MLTQTPKHLTTPLQAYRFVYEDVLIEGLDHSWAPLSKEPCRAKDVKARRSKPLELEQRPHDVNRTKGTYTEL
jgi:hypothetical protein